MSGREGSYPLQASTNERRQLTVLFSDLVGSTALAEALDPDDLRAFLSDYHRHTARIVRRLGGYVAQYLGDGVLVYFGYPAAFEHAPRRAVDAGITLLEELSTSLASHDRTGERLVRVGIHTGYVVLGDLGDELRPERLAVGAVPNIAARVQAEAEANSVYLTDATHALVEPYFQCEPVGTRSLKGIGRPMQLYRVRARRRSVPPFLATDGRKLSRFVGREAETKSLEALWHDGASTPRAAFITGGPGFGKSRIVYELEHVLPEHQSLTCYCAEQADSESLLPISQCIEQWCGITSERDLGERQSMLHSKLAALGQEVLYADIAAVLAIATEKRNARQSQPPLDQYELRLQRIVALFEAIAAHKPLLLIFEDLHWADASTLNFLRKWLARSEGRSLTIVTARSEFEVSSLGSVPIQMIRLDALPTPAAEVIAQDVARDYGVPVEAAQLERLRRAVEMSEGIPLFIEEVSRAALETETALGSEPALPSSLRDLLTSRLDRLGPEKTLIQLAACVGREVPDAWLRQLVSSGGPNEQLRYDLDAAVRAGILYRRFKPELIYVFTHALIRETAYETLTRSARETYHSRILALLASDPWLKRSQPMLLAHHAEAACLVEEAVDYLLSAGHRALASSAFTEASEIFSRGLRWVSQLPPTSERSRREVELLSARGAALISIYGYSAPDVEDVYRRASQICEHAGDVPLRTLYGIWGVHLLRADLRGIERLARSFERIVETNHENGPLLIAHSCLGVLSYFRGEFERGRMHCAEASARLNWSLLKVQHEALATEYGFLDLLSGPVWMAWLECVQGDSHAARTQMCRAFEAAELTEDPSVICQVACYAAGLHRELRDLPEVDRYTALALELSHTYNLHFWHALALCFRGWYELQRGDSVAAVQMAKQGLELLDAIGSNLNRGYFACCLVEAHLGNRAYHEGMRIVDHALKTCRESLSITYEAELLRLKGHLLFELARHDDAVEHARAALAQTRIHGLRLRELRAAVTLSSFLERRNRPYDAHEVLRQTCSKWQVQSEHQDLRQALQALATLDHAGRGPESRLK